MTVTYFKKYKDNTKMKSHYLIAGSKPEEVFCKQPSRGGPS